METLDAILTRRSVPRVTEDAPDRDTVKKLLDAAVRAPTHHLTQPWRFIVVAGDAREELGEAWMRGEESRGGDPEKLRGKTLRAPVLICVIEKPHTQHARVVEIEEHYAVGAAIENILLAAHALGLGAMIRTGGAATCSEVRKHLGIGDDELIAAFIYLGFPPLDAPERPMTKRKPSEEITEWLGWDD